MWRWSRETAQLQIARDHVALCPRDVRSTAAQLRKHPVTGLATVEDAITSCLAEGHGSNLDVDIVVSDAYARFWIVVPPNNATTRGDLRLCALWRFEELFGESPAAWNLQADWHATRRFMACAVPLALTDAIRSALSSRRIRIQCCVSRFVAEWNRHHRRVRKHDTWFGVSNDSIVTMALVQDQRIAHVRKVRQPSGEEMQLDTLASALRCVALQHEARLPESVLLCGDMPATRQATGIEGFHFEWVDGDARPSGNPESPAATLEGPSP